LVSRWRRPAVVLNIEQAPDQAIWLPDGRVQGQVILNLAYETVERIRSGYMCVKCLEPFPIAWPKLCPVCGCRVRTEQAAYFAREFGGEQHLGPSTSIDDEVERMHEEVEREQKENP